MARFEDTNGNFREDIHWISRIEGSIQTNRKIIEKSLGGGHSKNRLEIQKGDAF